MRIMGASGESRWIRRWRRSRLAVEEGVSSTTSASTLAPSAAPRRSVRAAPSWRRPLRPPSKSFDLRARNARAGGGGRLYLGLA
jgi:hypothetical protein